MSVSTVELEICGMSGASCAAKIQAALAQQAGVREAAVDLAAERATIRYGDEVTPLALVDAIRRLGYEVPVATAIIPAPGMCRASSVQKIEEALGRLDGVLSASVNAAAERVSVRYLPGQVALQDLLRVIGNLGHGAGASPSAAMSGETSNGGRAPDGNRERTAMFRAAPTARR